jgi:hypothetical protein
MGDVKKQQTGSMARIKDMTVKVWGIEERAVIISLLPPTQHVEKARDSQTNLIMKLFMHYFSTVKQVKIASWASLYQ